MKKNNLIINIFLSFLSTYIPLFFYSSYDYFSIKNISRIEIKRETQDYKLKIDAINKGYFPTFYPANLLALKKYPSIYPIGTLPNTFSYLGDEGYGMIKYKSDRFGLRNNNKKWKRIKNKRRI